jgi:hypothetical protein
MLNVAVFFWLTYGTARLTAKRYDVSQIRAKYRFIKTKKKKLSIRLAVPAGSPEVTDAFKIVTERPLRQFLVWG